jgi:hypothetical protein
VLTLKPVSFTESIKSILGQPLCWAALAAVLLFPLGLRNHTLWGYHEPYVGGIIREMTTSGNWVVPTLNGQPYLEKPPLFYALGAVGCRLFGTFQPWALRLPSALLAMATMLWACFMGWRLGSPRAGAWAGFMVGTNALFFQMGHAAVVDMTLTATVTLSLGLAFLAILEPEARDRWVSWFWASLGLGFLAKGIFGPVLVLLPLWVALGLWRDRRLLGAFFAPNWGMAALAGMVGLWVVPLALAGGRVFLEEVFVRNTIGRFLASPHLVPRTGTLGEHGEPFSFYLRRTPGNLLPSADTPEAVARALGSNRPVALLMEPKFFWKGNIEPRGYPCVEWQTQASRSEKLWGRAPALILNPGAARQCKSDLSAGSNRGYPDS